MPERLKQPEQRFRKDSKQSTGLFPVYTIQPIPRLDGQGTLEWRKWQYKRDRFIERTDKLPGNFRRSIFESFQGRRSDLMLMYSVESRLEDDYGVSLSFNDYRSRQAVTNIELTLLANEEKRNRGGIIASGCKYNSENGLFMEAFVTVAPRSNWDEIKEYTERPLGENLKELAQHVQMRTESIGIPLTTLQGGNEIMDTIVLGGLLEKIEEYPDNEKEVAKTFALLTISTMVEEQLGEELSDEQKESILKLLLVPFTLEILENHQEALKHEDQKAKSVEEVLNTLIADLLSEYQFGLSQMGRHAVSFHFDDLAPDEFTFSNTESRSDKLKIQFGEEVRYDRFVYRVQKPEDIIQIAIRDVMHPSISEVFEFPKQVSLAVLSEIMAEDEEGLEWERIIDGIPAKHNLISMGS